MYLYVHGASPYAQLKFEWFHAWYIGDYLIRMLENHSKVNPTHVSLSTAGVKRTREVVRLSMIKLAQKS